MQQLPKPPSTSPGTDPALDSIAEEEQAHPVVVSRCGEPQERAHLKSRIADLYAEQLDDLLMASEAWREVLDAVPDFEGRKIQVEPPELSEEEVEGQIDGLRNQFAELADVERFLLRQGGSS